jgi:sugar porter (SP) family MFS transporter
MNTSNTTDIVGGASSATTPANNISLNYYLFFVAIAVSLGGFVFGFDAAVISGVVGAVSREYQLDVWQEGLVVSAPTLAAIVASLTIVPLSDLTGRKRMLLIVAVLYVVSAVLAAVANGFVMLVVARAVGGLAFGSLMITPIYIAEIAPAKSRGMLVSINQLNIVLGLSAAYFSNYLLMLLASSHAEWVSAFQIDTQTWRWMLGIEILPAVLWVILLCYLPESPRWLLVKGRIEDARKVLLKMASKEETDAQIAEINTSSTKDNSNGSGNGNGISNIKQLLGQIFSHKMSFILLIGLTVGIAQQITGINAIFFFATSIFEQSGVGIDAAFAQAVLVGLINVVFTILAMVLIDKIGRRILLLVGLAGIVISLSFAGWGFHQATYQLNQVGITQFDSATAVALTPLVGKKFDSDLQFKSAVKEAIGVKSFKDNESKLIQSAVNLNPYIVLIGILVFVASFAFSLGPVMWVIFSEIFPNHLRGMAIAIVGFVNALVSFVVQFIFPWELATFGSAGTFFLYAIVGAIFFVLIAKIVPETKGLTLEEIERKLSRKRAA